MRENRKQKQKKIQLCRLKLGKKNPRTESLPTATPKAVGKEHFKKKYFLSLPTAELAASRQTIFEKKIFADCRGTSSRQSLPSGLTAPRGYADCWRGSWQRLCRLCATWQSANPPLPTQALPTALCRLPRGFAVGKAFADWVYAFADRGSSRQRGVFL